MTAYCGKESDNDSVGSTTTGDDATYSIALSKACSKPVSIVVSFVAGAKMLDEVKGEIDVPANFKMRAYVPTVTAGTTHKKHVSPFTHMAAELADNSTAGVSAEVVNNADAAIISTVLGGNAAVYSAQPKAVADYANASADEKQLLTLLSAVSTAAQSATGTTDGEKIQTVLNTLATQAKATVTDVTAGAYKVATGASATTSPLKTLNDGLTALNSSTDTKLASIKASVSSVQTAVTAPAAANTTTAASAGTTTVAHSTGIDAAKKLFAALRENLLSLENENDTGFLQAKSKAMSEDFDTIQGTGLDVEKLLQSIDRAAQLAEDVANNNTADLGSLIPNDVYGNYYNRYYHSMDSGSMMECAYYTTDGTQLQLKNKAVCRFHAGASSQTESGYSYADNVLELSRTSAGSYSYKSYVATTTYSYADFKETVTTTTAQTGTVSATRNANGDLTQISMTNAKFAPLVSGATDSTLNVTISTTTGTDVESADVSGSVSSGAVTLTLASGSKITSTKSSKTDTAKFVGQMKTSAFQYDGTLDLTDVAGTSGKAAFTGKISTLSAGTATEFFNGEVKADVLAQKDETQPESATNYHKGTVVLAGKVTNAGAVSSLSLTVDGTTYDQENISFTYNFGGSYSLTAIGVEYGDVTKDDTLTVTSSDGTKVELLRQGSSTSGTVKESGGNAIGTITSGKNQVDFTNGTYVTLL